MATRLVYDGSALDTEHIPGKHKMGEDGKPIKRKYVTAHQFKTFTRDPFQIWGLTFPKGVEVEVPPDLVARGFLKKAKALNCFQFVEEQPQLEAPSAGSSNLEERTGRRGPRKKADE